MPRPERLIFVCTNQRMPDAKESCAGHHDNLAFAAALKAEVKQQGLKPRLRVVRSSCLGVCVGGPHAYVSDGTWYAGARPEDAARIVTEHLRDGRPVEELRAPQEEAGS